MGVEHLPVLVVEADAELRDAVVEALYAARLEAHGALSANDALGVLGSHRRGWVILLDLTSSQVDGWALLEALKLFNVPADTHRVLVMSAQTSAKELRTHPLVHGIVDKPFDLLTLVSAVREVATLTRRAI